MPTHLPTLSRDEYHLMQRLGSYPVRIRSIAAEMKGYWQCDMKRATRLVETVAEQLMDRNWPIDITCDDDCEPCLITTDYQRIERAVLRHKGKYKGAAL